MKQIKLQDGYMVCLQCHGYVEAGSHYPACECLEDDITLPDADPLYIS